MFFEDIEVDKNVIQKYNIDLIDKTFQIFIDNYIKSR